MKKIILLLFFIGLSIKGSAQKCDAIIGNWLTATKEGHVEIYKKGAKYFGKITWIISPNDDAGKPRTDIRNIHPELRTRRILNLEILKDLNCDGSSYVDGTIYDPKRGKSFSCKLTINGDVLTVAGYVGMFPVHTEKWAKVK